MGPRRQWRGVFLSNMREIIARIIVTAVPIDV